MICFPLYALKNFLNALKGINKCKYLTLIGELMSRAVMRISISLKLIVAGMKTLLKKGGKKWEKRRQWILLSLLIRLVCKRYQVNVIKKKLPANPKLFFWRQAPQYITLVKRSLGPFHTKRSLCPVRHQVVRIASKMYHRINQYRYTTLRLTNHLLDSIQLQMT